MSERVIKPTDIQLRKRSITKIYPSYNAFTFRDNKEENGVSIEFANRVPKWDEMNKTNRGCYDCRESAFCEDCYNTYGGIALWDADNCTCK